MKVIDRLRAWRIQWVIEQIIKGLKRLVRTLLLKLNDPRTNRCGAPIQVIRRFGLGFELFVFPVLDESD
jgi:hypothetical protein